MILFVFGLANIFSKEFFEKKDKLIRDKFYRGKNIKDTEVRYATRRYFASSDFVTLGLVLIVLSAMFFMGKFGFN